MLQEASEIEKEKQLTMSPVDIKPFLTPVGVWETKWIRRLSHLSALTYRPNKVNVGFIFLLIYMTGTDELLHLRM